MRRGPFVASCFAALLLGVVATAQPGGDRPSAADTALLEVKIVGGDGAKLFLDGVPKSTRIRFGGMRPDTLYTHDVKVVFPRGETVERRVQLRGGWNVTLPMVRDSVPRPELVIQAGHSDAITGIACSPSGKYLATAGSGDRHVVLWDLESARELRAYTGYDAWTWCVAFSPDNARLAIGLNDGAVSLRDVVTGARGDDVRPDPRELKEVRSVAFDPVGKSLLIAGKGPKAYLWDFASGKVRMTYAGHERTATAVAFHPKAARVLIASEDGKARLYETDTGKLVRTYKGHGGPIRSALFSADGTKLLTASDDGAVALWDTDRAALGKLFRGPKTPLSGAVFTADPDVIVTASRDRSVWTWSTATGNRIAKLGEQAKEIECLVAGPDGRSVFSAGADCQAFRWYPIGQPDPAARKTVDVFRARVDRPYALAFSADGKRLVTGAGDDLLLFWDTASAAMVKRLEGPGRLIRYVDFSGDGRYFVTAADDGNVRLWNGKTGKAVGEPFKGHREYVISARFSPRGDLAVSSARAKFDDKGEVVIPGEAIVWEVPSGKKLGVYRGHRSGIWDAALDRDGKTLLTCGQDKKAILREVPGGKLLKTLEGHTDMVIAGEFTRDGSKVVTASMDNAAILWDVRTGKKLREFTGQHHHGLSMVRFLPGDKELVTVSFDGTICLWDVATAAKLRVFRGHTGPADTFALHPDGRHFVTGGGDGTIRYWDIATGEELAWWVAVETPDGKAVRTRDWIVATPDGLFDASSGARDNVWFRVDKKLGIVKVDRFFRDFNRPGLLTSLLAGKREMPNAVLGVGQAPLVKIVTPEPKEPVKEAAFTLEVEVADRGSGIGAVRLRQSGSQFSIVPQKKKVGDIWRYRYDVDLAPGENVLEVQAEGDSVGSPESEPKRLVVRLERPVVPGTLRVLAVGVSSYRDKNVGKLRFADLDAKMVAKLCRERGKPLYADIDVRFLGEKEATRKSILAELDDIAKVSKTGDTVVLFFAGHGTLDDESRFYLVPHDYDGAVKKTRSECLAQSAISGKELVEKVVGMKALNRLVVLDTCSSGAVQEDLRRVASQSDAISRNTGIFMLVGALEGKIAEEGEALGHGLLTYTLLAAVGGVDKGKLKDSPLRDKYATALDLVKYVSERITELVPDLEIPLITAPRNFKVMPVRTTGN